TWVASSGSPEGRGRGGAGKKDGAPRDAVARSARSRTRARDRSEQVDLGPQRDFVDDLLQQRVHRFSALVGRVGARGETEAVVAAAVDRHRAAHLAVVRV